MIHLIMFIDHFPKAVASYSTQARWEEDYDNVFEGERRRTMGQLLGRLRKIGIPYEGLEIKLKESLTKRNWLMHSYFSDRAMEFMSEAGRNKMISELEQSRDLFMDVDAAVSKIYYEIADKYGLTQDVLNKLMEEMMVEAKSDL